MTLSRSKAPFASRSAVDNPKPLRPQAAGLKAKTGHAFEIASVAFAYIFAAAALIVIACLIIYVR